MKMKTSVGEAKNTNAHLKKSIKHSAIYAVGTILRRITALVMLPIYTRYLTPADYGVVELLTMAIEIASILVGFRISQGLFRYYILAKTEQEKHEIVSTVLLTIIASSAIGALFLYLGAESLTVLIFGNNDYTFEFQLFALTLISNAISAVGLSYLRARQMPILFVSIGIVTLVLQVILNIIFVVMLELHVTGVVYSSVISGGIIALGLSLYVFISAGIHYSTEIAFKLVKFVSPLMLASVAAFYVAYADKYFLRLFAGLTEVGLYTLAARVSAVLVTAFEAFNMSWGADRFEVVKKDNARLIFEQIFRYISIVVIMIGGGLALFANDFFRIMTSPEFYPASLVVPILVLAYLFNIGTMFCNFGALYKDKTSIMAHASWIKAIIATIGYLSLIPLAGIYGAAFVLALSNLFEFAWIYHQSKKLYDMELNWWPVLIILVCVSFVVVTGLLLPAGEIIYFALRITLFVALIPILYMLPIWKTDERAMMKAGLKKLKAP